MFENIKNAYTNLTTKSLTVDQIQMALLAASEARWPDMTYAIASANGYNDNAIVYRCINIRGDSLGALRWTVYGPDDKPVKSTHPLQKLIDRPNKQQSQSDFISSLSKYRDLGGDGYILANKTSPNAKPTELSLVRPDQVTIQAGEYGLPAKYTIMQGVTSKTCTVDAVSGKCDLLQWKIFNPLSDMVGLSPLASASKPVAIFNESQVHYKKLLQNGANLGGVLSTEGKLDKEQFERLEKNLNTKYAGSDNAGKMMVVEGGMKYDPTAQTPKDMGLTKAQTEQARYIAQAFSVPDQMIGIPGSSTFANFSEARVFYNENTLIPLAESLQESLNNWLAPMFTGNVTIKYDEDSIPGLEGRRADKFTRLESVSFMSINEKREEVGLPPIAGGDVVSTNINTNESSTDADDNTEVDDEEKE